MCGISGIFGLSYVPLEADLRKMTSEISHRGPDGEGIWVDMEHRIGLGHRRLAIIDLSEHGKQPMHYTDKYTITFNGEIYNYIEIRAVLETKGYIFHTHSDTEVILASYDYWKEECLKEFDGMFAFALYDKERNELFCARDRFGEKPFYYHLDDEKFAFASEMKSLWKIGVPKDTNPYSVYLFLNYNLDENPEDSSQTFFRTIFKLKKAHFIKFKQGQPIIQQQYWRVDHKIQNFGISFAEACEKFRELFYNSVRLRLRSDVPVGTSLSGGLDSSTVVSVINEILAGKSVQKTFSARFPDTKYDEGYFMEKVIEGKKIDQYCTYPSAQGMIGQMDKLMYHQEEPFITASIYAQWEVFKLAKANDVTVLLDGQGADEYLAGYTVYFVPYFREILKTHGKKSLNAAIRDYKTNNIVEDPFEWSIQFQMETFFPDVFKKIRAAKHSFVGTQPDQSLDPELYNSFKHRTPPFPYFADLNSALMYSISNFGLEKLLRYADRNAMASSIETRLPFLDHKLVEFVFSMPADYKIREGWTKAILRSGMKDVLPKEITWRKNKLGFQPPQKQWEKESSWRDWANDFHGISKKNNWVNKNADISWKSINLGVFQNMLDSH